MNVAFISSLKDKASLNIKENLVNNFGFEELEEKFDNNNIFQYLTKDIKLYTINSELVHAENIDKNIDAELFIFISKHSAKEERKCLTAHAPGNFGKALLGGKEKALCTAPSAYMKGILGELSKNSQDSDYEATMEATHHGPFLEKPVLFVEIGSSEKEWEDKDAGNIIAKSVISAIENDNNSSNGNNSIINNESINKKFNEKDYNIINNNSIKKINKNNYESIFVIGGSHYNHVAAKAMLKSNLAVGHICAKYNLENLDYELIKQAMEKTVPKAEFVLLDWKGLGKEKQRILEILEKNDIDYKRSDKFFEKSG